MFALGRSRSIIIFSLLCTRQLKLVFHWNVLTINYIFSAFIYDPALEVNFKDCQKAVSSTHQVLRIHRKLSAFRSLHGT